MMLARQLGKAPGYAPINDPKVPTDHGRMLLTLFHRIIDFLRIIKLLYTHTWQVATEDHAYDLAGVFAIEFPRAPLGHIRLQTHTHAHI